MNRRVYFVCNALDEVTRDERNIGTDSPAASKKVFELCAALRSVGVQATAVSMGRGKAKFRAKSYAAKVSRVERFSVVYAWFVELPILSQLVTVVSLAQLIMILPRGTQTAVIFYNRHPAYLLATLVAKIRGFKNILDLEDGEVRSDGRLSSRTYLNRFLFDWLCQDGALLACDSLAEMTSIKSTLSYYGIATPKGSVRNWQDDAVRVLFGGTLSETTGANQFLGAVELLRSSNNYARNRIEFHVTGSGERLAEMAVAAQDNRAPRVIVHSRLSFAEYNKLLEDIEVGLALKPPEGPLANSTFPSKVIEYAAAQILVLSTDVSDVKAVLQPYAMFLEDSEPETLARMLLYIAERPELASQTSRQAKDRILTLMSKTNSGQKLVNFIFEQ